MMTVSAVAKLMPSPPARVDSKKAKSWEPAAGAGPQAREAHTTRPWRFAAWKAAVGRTAAQLRRTGALCVLPGLPTNDPTPLSWAATRWLHLHAAWQWQAQARGPACTATQQHLRRAPLATRLTGGIEVLHSLVAQVGGGGAVQPLVLEAAQAHVVCKGGGAGGGTQRAGTARRWM